MMESTPNPPQIYNGNPYVNQFWADFEKNPKPKNAFFSKMKQKIEKTARTFFIVALETAHTEYGPLTPTGTRKLSLGSEKIHQIFGNFWKFWEIQPYIGFPIVNWWIWLDFGPET